MTFTYPAVFQPQEDGSYKGYFPDLDGCTFEGPTLDETLNAAIEAERSWIEIETDEDETRGLPYISEHEDIPVNEGEFIRDIAVIIHFEVGYY